MPKQKTRISIDQVESVYLNILRVAVLSVATLSLIAALGFAIDGLWRLSVGTDVQQAATSISPAEVIAAMKEPAPVAERGEAQIPAGVRAAHNKFSSDVFPKYYAVYRKASEAYRKPEDKTLSQSELMAGLGYDLDTYASGEVLATKQFVENVAYQQQAQAAVTAAMSDATALRQLGEYKAAQKTAQSCTTESERRTFWDPNSTACSDWFYPPYGCNVTRSVPVERCVPAYPEGIVSPTVAFGRADDAFRTLWAQRTEQNAQAASSERYSREKTRSKIGPRLMLALQIILGFLVVMFFFLLIAVERHLRRVAGSTADDQRTPDRSSAPLPNERSARSTGLLGAP